MTDNSTASGIASYIIAEHIVQYFGEFLIAHRRIRVSELLGPLSLFPSRLLRLLLVVDYSLLSLSIIP
jgi:hypothetical protein